MMKFRISVAGETVKLSASSVSELGAVVDVACRYGILTVERRPDDCQSEYLTPDHAAEELQQLLAE